MPDFLSVTFIKDNMFMYAGNSKGNKYTEGPQKRKNQNS